MALAVGRTPGFTRTAPQACLPVSCVVTSTYRLDGNLFAPYLSPLARLSGSITPIYAAARPSHTLYTPLQDPFPWLSAPSPLGRSPLLTCCSQRVDCAERSSSGPRDLRVRAHSARSAAAHRVSHYSERCKSVRAAWGGQGAQLGGSQAERKETRLRLE